MNIQIIIACHKSCPLPTDTSIYVPLQVGAKGRLPIKALNNQNVLDPSGSYAHPLEFQRDDTGEEISAKNPYFCELTGAYWAWKNLDADLLGLVHYRRYFSAASRSYIRTHAWQDCVLNEAELQTILSGYAESLYGDSTDPMQELLQNGVLIVPKKRHYYIETLYSHYSHTLEEEHLDLCRKILAKMEPTYVEAFDQAMKQTWGYMWNMMIASRSVYDRYMNWLFPILEELEKRIDLTGLTPFQQRLFGRVSELLFNVWVYYESRLKSSSLLMLELPVLHTEPENWPLKIRSFLAAKFFGKKYTESF
jgi:hypothetical protein